ncbi:unnamed protein product [Durusdinium trenchii]|uniref:Uncharacterized protein n=2 Tax=Durusdinium trenchii TaxID=1381693 RepID=A0ABP0LKL3_9DINO
MSRCLGSRSISCVALILAWATLMRSGSFCRPARARTQALGKASEDPEMLSMESVPSGNVSRPTPRQELELFQPPLNHHLTDCIETGIDLMGGMVAMAAIFSKPSGLASLAPSVHILPVLVILYLLFKFRS